MSTFDAGSIEASATLDKTSFISALAAIRADAAKGITVPIKFDTSQAGVAASIASAEAVVKAMVGKGFTIPLIFSTSGSDIAATVASAKKAAQAAAGQGVSIPLIFNTSQVGMAATIASAKAVARQMIGQGVSIPINFVPNFGGAAGAAGVAGLLGGAAGGGGGGGGGAAAGAAAGGAGGSWGWGGGWFLGNAFIGGWRKAVSALGGQGGKIPLFGGSFGGLSLPGILAAVGGVHLLIDAVAELAAVWIPATVAVGVFSAAAVPTVLNIAHEMQNVSTVSDALGTHIYPLTGAFQRMADAVQPRVYVLFGEALNTMAQNSGLFQRIAVGTGTVLDQLGARVEAALQSHGFSVFFANAVHDVYMLGTAFGNVFGAIGNILRAVPGYANTLLTLGTAGTKVIEWATNVAEPVLKAGLAFHGAFLYVGLGATLIGKLLTSGLGAAATGLENLAIRAVKMGSGFEGAAGPLMRFSGLVGDAATLPWGWIAAAAIAVGFLAYKIITAKDATEQWFSAQQNVLFQAPLVRGMTLALQDQAVVAHRLADAQRSLAAAQSHTIAGMNFSDVATRNAPGILISPVQIDKTQVADYTAALHTMGQESSIVSYRMNVLNGIFGGQTKALGLAAMAGITYGDMVKYGKQQLEQIIIEMKAADSSLAAMTIGSGRSAAALNAMAFSTGNLKNQTKDYLPDMQKLVQAEDTVSQVVFGGEQAFTSYVQALLQTRQAVALTGGSIKGLGTNGIAAANVFYNTLLPAAQKVIDALQMQDTGTRHLTEAIATEVKQMLPFTQQNDAAKGILISMINNALGPGTVSFRNLDTWVKHNATSMKGFQSIVGESTIKAGELSNTISNMATNVFQQFLFSTSHASSAIKTYTQLLIDNKGQTDAGRQARAQLIQDLEKAGMSAKQAAAYVHGLGVTIDGIHGKNVTITETGHGTFTISGYGSALTFSPTSPTGRKVGAAQGAYISAGTPGVDDQLVMAQRGELVVPTRMVSAGLVDHLRGSIPGFASGGVVGSSNNLGPATAYWANNYLSAFTNSMIDSMKGVTTALANSFTSGSAGGPAGGAPAANMRIAQQMFPWPSSQWPAFNAVEMREAGYQLNATNSSSGAYGMAQFIGGPSEYYQYGGNPYTAAGQLTGMFNYIRQRYGVPSNAWAHEQAYGWYDRGGWLPPGVSIAVNGTGRPEPVGWGRAGGGQPLVGSVTFSYGNAGDVGQAMNDLLFTMRHAKQAGYGGAAL